MVPLKGPLQKKKYIYSLLRAHDKLLRYNFQFMCTVYNLFPLYVTSILLYQFMRIHTLVFVKDLFANNLAFVRAIYR